MNLGNNNLRNCPIVCHC